MTYALSPRSLSFCSRVDPRMLAVAKMAITLSTQDFGVTAEQTRTEAEEAEEVAQGFSHTMHSHHVIGYGEAAPGCSGAIDLVPWNGSAFVWQWPLIYPIAAAMKAASLRLATPITWGGCWDKLMSEIVGSDAEAMQAAQTGFDGPHYELGVN